MEHGEGLVQEWSFELEKGQGSPTISLPPISASSCPHPPTPGVMTNSRIPTLGFSSPYLTLGSPLVCLPFSSLCFSEPYPGISSRPCSYCSPFWRALSLSSPLHIFFNLQDPTQSLSQKVSLSFSELTQPHCLCFSIYILLFPFLPFFLPHCGWLMWL